MVTIKGTQMQNFIKELRALNKNNPHAEEIINTVERGSKHHVDKDCQASFLMAKRTNK